MQLERDPDLGWVGALSGCTVRAAARAIARAQSERKLFSHLAREHRREGRDAYGEIDAPLELHALVELVRPHHVLEVGVSSGVSSAYLLSALERNGRGTLHSVDLPSKRRPPVGGKPPRASWSLPDGRQAGWAVPFPLRKRWDLRLGDKAEVLPILAGELPSIEILVYDVPHACDRSWKEFQVLNPLLPPGGIAIVDHGPGGGLCPSLRRWAQKRGGQTRGREGTGLFGMRVRNQPLRGTDPGMPSREVS